MSQQWVQKGNIRGPQGPKGEQGAKGQAGASARVATVNLSPNSDVAVASLQPSVGVAVGDVVVDLAGDVYTVTGIVNETTAHIGQSTGVNLTGPKGDQGPAGKDGTGVNIKGSFESDESLPESGEPGDAYLVDGDLYVWDGSKWKNVGTIQGPQGDQGPKGDQGPQGPAGEDGPQGVPGPGWMFGSGAPSGGQAVGTPYLDTSTGDVWAYEATE